MSWSWWRLLDAVAPGVGYIAESIADSGKQSSSGSNNKDGTLHTNGTSNSAVSALTSLINPVGAMMNMFSPSQSASGNQNWLGKVGDFLSWPFESLGMPSTTELYGSLSGQSNTAMQNAAAAALQEDAQAFNAEQSAEQRAWESAEAEKNRQWQEQMSNTSYQRSMADLQAAGLNPWLAVGNGAGTGSPVMSTGSAASSPVANAQVSNVSMLQGIGSAAGGLALLIKVLKAVV